MTGSDRPPPHPHAPSPGEAGAAAAAREAFVRAHTTPSRAPLVPEIVLQLATEITPLWSATEGFLARHGVEPPYWAFAWPGAQAAARWILDHPDDLAGATVVDFAAGGGLAAIAAARRGARVRAVEIDPLAGAAIRVNADLNGVALEVLVADLVEGPPLVADLLICGDVCYSREMVAHILPWLRRCVDVGTRVLLVDPGRSHLPAGLVVEASYEVPTLLELEDRPVRTTRLLRLGGSVGAR